ncbi:hypothetical protein [Bacteroides acidifaciens]|jgi:hypothetical protein|uniref:hypothetical protein n=1 Tax=Bacteroides acidifaciens TaxID=85831 RepID=UPI0025939BD9|nr:hypothetical protein [Bacteroides acidifaciens]
MGVQLLRSARSGGQSRFGRNLPPSERIPSENLAPVNGTPQEASGNGNKRRKENRKTACTEH